MFKFQLLYIIPWIRPNEYLQRLGDLEVGEAGAGGDADDGSCGNDADDDALYKTLKTTADYVTYARDSNGSGSGGGTAQTECAT